MDHLQEKKGKRSKSATEKESIFVINLKKRVNTLENKIKKQKEAN